MINYKLKDIIKKGEFEVFKKPMGHINITVLILYFIISRFNIFAYIKNFSKFCIEKGNYEWFYKIIYLLMIWEKENKRMKKRKSNKPTLKNIIGKN